MAKTVRVAISGGEGADDEPLALHFIDGRTHECDVLIGADGIHGRQFRQFWSTQVHSTVRKFILGEDDPALSPRDTGLWAVVALEPYAVAQASLGEGLVNIEDAREYSWVGDGAYLMHNVLSQGELVQFIISSEAKSMPDSWYRTVSAEHIRKLYENWPPHLSKALLCDQPQQPAMYLWVHLPARTYVSGPKCVIGDAAHATTPWQGSRAGMSIEDSLVISTLLGRSKNREEALVALKTYDEARRPRTQRIIQSSRATGVIEMGRGDETGLNLDRLRQKLLPRWDFIIDFDNEKHVAEAVEVMKRRLSTSKNILKSQHLNGYVRDI
ncbi:hypothetical protein DHEL01_v207376 [Diaporthe helianthi]|uniref:FAD-binding domain-containing protein n=1 Tax=Diaporthe helianthi TaxID=158607 RepID=A0A2P5HVE6_DIAHE|nr:hypothetical protein DHEL01_v207376 [Diaporthe helianthi]